MSSTYQKQALKSIKNQIGDQPPDQVYVIELDGIPFEEITPEMKSLFETCSALQMLTINNCNLTSLKNFPRCQAMIRLDLISNKLKGSDLNYLQSIRHIQTLYLSQNEFKSIHDFNQISHMKKLLQLNLIGNDVCDVDGYEKQMFSIFPSLKILDGYDHNQKQPSEKNLLKESVNRINKNLFESSPSKPIVMPAAPIKSIFSSSNPATVTTMFNKPILTKKNEETKQTKKKNNKVEPTKKNDKKSKNQMDIEKPQKKKSLKRSIKQVTGAKQIFPKGRITRYLRQRLPTYRISPKSAVFLTGCLEYLCLDLLDIATEEAKRAKKKRIMPEHIIQAVKQDEEFNKALQNVTVAGKRLI